MKRFITLLAALFSLSVATAQSEDYAQKGYEAYAAKNYSVAVAYWTIGADQGNAYSQRNLGYCYDLGYGVTKDYTEAAKWYRKAAEQGHAHRPWRLLSLWRRCHTRLR